MLAALIAFLVFGLVSLILMAAVFMVIGAASLLVFKLAPILLIGWLVLKLLRRSEPRRGLSAADRRWLDE